MKRALLLLLCAGCSHTHMVVDNRTTQGSVQVRTHAGPDLVTLLGLTIIAATIVDMERDSVRRRDDPLGSRDAPPLAADRAVFDHDCTRPVAEYSGNLRCR